MAKSEHQEQVAFIHAAKKYLVATGNEYMKPLLFAIPNGGKRDQRTAASLKMEGVRAGVPDLFFAKPTKSAYGLFIEMKKVVGGAVSKDQKKMLEALEDEGYVCRVARGGDQAIQIFKDYIEDRI
ncbi:MAG: VRR-NUC domain-containing protein [Dehalococcoidia bacterium]|nr:MAG: VRR-NUC domain-containing protein [Dehalococcoidia bacterium]